MEIIDIKNEALAAIAAAKNEQELIEVRNNHLSKKAPINLKMGEIKNVPNEKKKEFGEAINNARNEIIAAFDIKKEELHKIELNKKLVEETIDITLPGIKDNKGSANPFYLIQDEIIEIFLGMGYTLAEGRDVESDHYNFELMNIPKDHPAREMQDSFYINPNTLLRTHTSPAQAHAMEKANGQPIKIICPGKCFRRDDDDLTHSHQFGQIEGLVVGKNINVGNLEKTLETFIKKLFGEKRSIRLRSSYFPFTEPSFEVDVSCEKCGGKGCSACKGSGYIEILGSGIVNPHVLEMNGYDPNIYSGFAFGVGIERVAFLRYGIDDMRRIYANDIRFIKQFKER